jgi:hypothetical protein
MTVPDAPLRARPAGTLAAGAAVALGLVVAAAGERTLLGAAALWGEPLLVALALQGGVWLWAAGRRAFAGGLALVVVVAVAAAHRSAPVLVAPDTAVDPSLVDCVNLAPRVRAPIRAVVWAPAAEPTAAALDALRQADPDLIVLSGLPDGAAGAVLAAGLGGEAQHLGAAPGGLTVVVRGRFAACGAESAWSTPVPDGGADSTLALLLPEVRDAGQVPLVVARFSRPGPVPAWPAWPGRVVAGSRAVAALSSALGSRRTLAILDTGVPRTFSRVQGHLRGGGLDAIGTPATWPARLGPLPGLPLHALQQVHAGDVWSAARARLLSLDGGATAPLWVELDPG